MSGVGVHLDVWLYPEQSLKEPSIQDKPWYLQQGDEDEMDRVGLPQHCSNRNEGRGCLHLRNNQAMIKNINNKHSAFWIKEALGKWSVCEKKKSCQSCSYFDWWPTFSSLSWLSLCNKWTRCHWAQWPTVWPWPPQGDWMRTRWNCSAPERCLGSQTLESQSHSHPGTLQERKKNKKTKRFIAFIPCTTMRHTGPQTSA